MRPAPREPSKQLNAKSLPATKRRAASGAFRAGRAGCEQDQNHHCQSSNHTEASPVTFSDSDLLLVSVRQLGLALSHDGLWVFANRILANRIFAHRVLS